MTSEITPKQPIPPGWEMVATGSDFNIVPDILSDEVSPEEARQDALRLKRKEAAARILENQLTFTQENPRNDQIFGSILHRIAYRAESIEDAEACARTLLQVARELRIDDQLSDVACYQFLGWLPDDLFNETLSSQVVDFAQTWRQALMDSEQSEANRSHRLRNFGEQLRRLTGSNTTKPTDLAEQEMADMFRAAVRSYEHAYELLDQESDIGRRNQIERWMSEISLAAVRWRDARQTDYMDQINQYAFREDDDTIKMTQQAVHGYLWNAPLTQQRTDAFINIVTPRIKGEDASIQGVLRGGNSVGMYKDDFGIASFEIHELTGQLTPANLREGINILRSMPTSSMHRFESNRRDGLQLAGPFGILRDAIHDQRPGVHDVLRAMVQYYEDHDNEAFLQAIDGKCDYIRADNCFDKLLDLNSYDTIRPTRTIEGEEMPDEAAIDIVRRLEHNTRPVDDVPPELHDKELSVRLHNIYKADASDKNAQLKAVSEYVNAKLSTMIKEKRVGIEPELIAALAWLENEQFKYMQGLKFEHQSGLARQGIFQQILLTHELTHNDNFSQAEFDSFLEKVARMDDQTAARAIAQRVMRQVSALATAYKARGKSDWVEALWSGNVTHELLGMIDAREAATALGKKMRAERLGARDAY